MNIVPLHYSNVPFAVALAQEMHKLSTFETDGPPFDWDYTYKNMAGTITDRQYYFRLAFTEDGYCGAVCGRVMPYYFSPKLFGVEEAWYVREGTPSRAKVATALMMGFVDWCLEAQGAHMVQSGDIAAINSLGVDTLYKHLGFKRNGSAYQYMRTLQ